MKEIANACARAIKKSGLTNRETEVLQIMARGRSNKEIAGALSISEGTVKLYVKSINKKLGCRNRVESAVMCCKAQFSDEVDA